MTVITYHPSFLLSPFQLAIYRCTCIWHGHIFAGLCLSLLGTLPVAAILLLKSCSIQSLPPTIFFSKIFLLISVPIKYLALHFQNPPLATGLPTAPFLHPPSSCTAYFSTLKMEAAGPFRMLSTRLCTTVSSLEGSNLQRQMYFKFNKCILNLKNRNAERLKKFEMPHLCTVLFCFDTFILVLIPFLMISRCDKSIQQQNYTRRALSSGMCYHVD
jgi:hypothetical protein